MGHGHDHAARRSADRSRLRIAIAIVASVLVIEVVGAVLSGSLALLADAGHMFSDLAGLVVALVASVVAGRPATDRQTFGYQRVEVFAALVNALILLSVAALVTVQAIGRLTAPGGAEVAGGLMLAVAAVGLVANVTALFVLRPSSAGSLNMRGAYLEVLGDTLGSVAAIAAALVILLTGFGQADAIASLLIAAMIVPRAVSLLRDVVRVLSQGAPAETDVAAIRRHIEGTEGVVGVHDIHVWSITSGAHVFSAHVIVDAAVLSSGGAGPLLDRLDSCLSEHFDVEHSTFQLEPSEHAEHEERSHR